VRRWKLRRKVEKIDEQTIISRVWGSNSIHAKELLRSSYFLAETRKCIVAFGALLQIYLHIIHRKHWYLACSDWLFSVNDETAASNICVTIHHQLSTLQQQIHATTKSWALPKISRLPKEEEFTARQNSLSMSIRIFWIILQRWSDHVFYKTQSW